MMNRRDFLRAGAGSLALARFSKLSAAEAATPRPPFRVLYGNDTTHTVSCVSPWHKRGEPFRAKLLEATVDEVAGRGVDAHLLQPGLGWIPWWKSKVYPADEHYRWFTERTGLEPANPYPAMLGRPEEMRAWQVPAAPLRDGPNRLEVLLESGDQARLAFFDLGLR